MKLYKYKNQLLIVYLAVGFFVGIIYENIVSQNHGIYITMFQAYYLNQYQQSKIVTEEYLGYVLKARVIPFIGVCVLGRLKWKRLLVGICLIWTGFLLGILSVLAIVQLGIKGILFFLSGILPHMIFYGLAYGMILGYLYHYPKKQWNEMKTIFVTLMMFVGILLETYVNPMLMKFIIPVL